MASTPGPRLRHARNIAALAVAIACFAPVAAQVPAAVTPALDQGATINLPAIGSGDVSVLGPSTARLRATIDPDTAATAVYFRYGDGSVLDQRTPSIMLGAGVDPTQVVQDLLDLEPGSSYNVQLVAETPLGTIASNSVPFNTPLALYVNPTTGGVVSATSTKKKTRCTILGTNKKNKLVGTKRRDVICSLGGNDRIYGRGGNDLIIAGKGNDRASGGVGNDRIYGNSGRDRMFGGSGADRFYDNTGSRGAAAARRNRDYVSGGSGRDVAKVNKTDRVRSVERVSRRR
jgi:RTX calcium-binding nonapeptide repeat (4 copies)